MSAAPSAAGSDRHLPVLDGVRGVSILVVLATHLLPLRIAGRSWNDSAGMFGMALFFVLSGFLITTQLLARPTPGAFAIRRLSRIVPAAWLCTLIVAVAASLDAATVVGHLLFYANLPPQRLAPALDHFWSLCVEVQFYTLAAALLWLRPACTWWLLPALLGASTGLRLIHSAQAGSVTWFRADDLLAGACLALAMRSRFWSVVSRPLGVPGSAWWWLLLLAAASVLPRTGVNALSYLRPYLAAALVAALLVADPGTRLSRLLRGRLLGYVAAVSYALYVWHVPLVHTWLGSGDLVEKYLKRPLLLVVLFAVAHVSTFRFERRVVDWGKRLARRRGTAVASA